MEISGKTVNFLGDSITEGVGASDKAHCYVSVFGEKYGATVRNYGISGSRIARQRFVTNFVGADDDFCRRADKMEDADIVCVFGGTNDYGHGNAPIGEFSDRTEETFYGACHYLFRTLIERYPDALIIVMTPLHRTGEQAQNPEQKYKPNPLIDYVNIIREVAEFYSLPVLDLYKISGMQPEIPVIKERYMPDGLHPSDKGHEKIADMLASFIRAW